MSLTKKRFWRQAATVARDGGHGVTLDGKPVRTPAGAEFIAPSAALARAVAAEWDAQIKDIDPASMPLTRTVNSAIDRVTPRRDEVAAMIAAYGASDLLCYRAPHPDPLIARQAAGWDPLLDWARDRYGAPLRRITGVMHRDQPPASVAALAGAVDAFDAFRLTALHDLVAMSGSLLLGLAVAEGRLDAPGAWALSRIDEDFQAELWGADEEAAAHAAKKRADFLDAARFLDLLAA